MKSPSYKPDDVANIARQYHDFMQSLNYYQNYIETHSCGTCMDEERRRTKKKFAEFEKSVPKDVRKLLDIDASILERKVLF